MIIYLIHSLQSWLILCEKTHWYPIIPPLIILQVNTLSDFLEFLKAKHPAIRQVPAGDRGDMRVSWKWRYSQKMDGL